MSESATTARDTGEREYWFTCSQCGVLQLIGNAEAHGEKPINCSTPTCGFQNRQGRVKPLVSGNKKFEDLRPEDGGKFDRTTWSNRT